MNKKLTNKIVKKNRYTFFISEDQLIWLEEIKEKTGSPVSETIRRALDDYKKNNK